MFRNRDGMIKIGVWLVVFTMVVSLVIAFIPALLALESRSFGDVSTGIVPIPVWLVQVPMVAGLALLTLALLQSLAETWRARAPVLGGGEEA